MNGIRFAVILLALAASGFSTVVHARSESESVLAVRWVACTGAENSPPYFTIEVTREGEIRYVGGEAVREKGEKRTQSTPAKAARIFRIAHKVLDSHAQRRVAPFRKELNPYLQYCLQIVFDGVAENGESRVSGLSRPAIALRESIDAEINTHSLVCPTPTVQLADGGYCGPRKVILSFSEFDGCVFRHEVAIFANGESVYYLLRGRGGQPISATDYFYFTLSRSQLRELVDVAADYTEDFRMVPQSRGTGRSSKRLPDNPRFFMNPAQIDEFKTALARIAGLRWHMPPDDAACEPRHVFDGGIAIYR